MYSLLFIYVFYSGFSKRKGAKCAKLSVSCVWGQKSMYKEQGALTAHLLASEVPSSREIAQL